MSIVNTVVISLIHVMQDKDNFNMTIKKSGLITSVAIEYLEGDGFVMVNLSSSNAHAILYIDGAIRKSVEVEDGKWIGFFDSVLEMLEGLLGDGDE